LNDGKGNLNRLTDAFDRTVMLTASCVAPYDFNGDGYIDFLLVAELFRMNMELCHDLTY
jgi:hypothetical protein